jgi:hypothetical protein
MMELADYNDLVTSIDKWTKERGDLTELIDVFILLAENDFYSREEEPLRLRSMETSSDLSLVTNSGSIALPTDYLETRAIRIRATDGTTREITYRTPEMIRKLPSVGEPCFFTVTNQLEFDINADQTYTVELKYYKRIAALNSSNTTNDILTNNPNIYLYGVLAQAHIYSDDSEQLQKYVALADNAIRAANLRDKKGRYGPSPQMRVRHRTP